MCLVVEICSLLNMIIKEMAKKNKNTLDIDSELFIFKFLKLNLLEVFKKNINEKIINIKNKEKII